MRKPAQPSRKRQPPENPGIDGLYDTDVLGWSERQASILRRVTTGEPGNEAPDWPNIIEEIESVGRGGFNAVRPLLVQTFLHDLKCQAWPNAPYVPHGRAEARGFRDDAARSYTPSMRQRIGLARLYREALGRLPELMDGQPPLPVPQECPATLDEMLKHWKPHAAWTRSPVVRP